MIRPRLSLQAYIEGILAQDRFVLSRAITLIESQLPSDNELGLQIIEKLLSHTGNSLRIGITGVPGVGKSTFIEAFGNVLLAEGKKIAVLAIDPSSQRSAGSIMGDKTRMATLSHHPQAYIRPSPSGSSLGGVSQKTREAMLLCEAAGYDTIIVETVGVGQSETAVAAMTDFFLLLMLAGAGDELQGIKKGIMEMADLVAITKADEDNELQAQRAKATYQNAIMLFANHEGGWFPPVLTCSAVKQTGLHSIWEQIQQYELLTKTNGFWQHKRQKQQVQWLHQTINRLLTEQFYAHEVVKNQLQDIEKNVEQGSLHATTAALHLVKLIYPTYK
jgi:LAO/AO transport system kinase